ncbi:hypothetical protein J4E06_04875 [Muricauda sp. NFXS6]|uniref:hypothetical protein n=1 Tax=Allomuricauda sp. NFXS6 TaxID=2819094 RepID=UPI0032DED36D
MDWEKTDNRFVAFFDVLGFKDMVQRKSHSEILKKLENLKSHVEKLEGHEFDENKLKKANLEIVKYQTRSVTFSDSFLFFSKKDSKEDLVKILVDSWYFLKYALKNKIAVKGAISFGKITLDFEKNLFFGQPIIDAYLLHEDLNMLGVVFDHNAENQCKTYDELKILQTSIGFEKVRLKYGGVNHSFVAALNVDVIQNLLESLDSMYSITSGKPRVYIDNSIDFYGNLKDKLEKESKQSD